MRHLLLGPFLNWARKLKFPALFKLVAALFVVNLFIPDPIPFIDEIILGLGTLLLANWKDRNKAEPAQAGKGATIDGESRRE